MLACSGNYLALVQLLCYAGADVNATDWVSDVSDPRDLIAVT